ncbi:MAG: Fe2+-dependent dioxygenase [Pseudomonadota bacterium]
MGAFNIFIEVQNLLNPAELAEVRRLAAEATFVDGRITNPHNTTKNNTQIDYADSAFQKSSKILGDALFRCEEFRNFSLFRRVAPPLLCRYASTMAYGVHSDAPFIPMQPTPLRSDVSCTIFISDPQTYDGGALTIHLGSKPVEIKGAAGSAVIYPSTTLHEVAPVTRGERLVAITFIESMISDERKRNLLYTLNEVSALEGFNISPENRMRLEHVRNCLNRMWSS